MDCPKNEKLMKRCFQLLAFGASQFLDLLKVNKKLKINTARCTHVRNKLIKNNERKKSLIGIVYQRTSPEISTPRARMSLDIRTSPARPDILTSHDQK
jgi:hypothetical protein